MLRHITVLLCAGSAMLYADMLTLRNGTTVQGTYAGGDTRSIKMLVGDHVQVYQVGEVTNLVFGDTGGDQSAYAAPQAPAYPQATSTPPPSPAYPQAEATPPQAPAYPQAQATPPPAPDYPQAQ